MSAGFLVAAAFLAGLVSFSSPCCLPLLPGYVADVSGDHEARRAGQTLTAAGLFTLGFGVTFAALGASASWLGGLLLRGAGLLVGTVGLLTVMSAEPRVLASEPRLLALHRIPTGSGAGFAVPLGAVFALGQAGEKLGVAGLPTTLSIAADGTVRGRHAGTMTATSLRAAIDTYLGCRCSDRHPHRHRPFA